MEEEEEEEEEDDIPETTLEQDEVRQQSMRRDTIKLLRTFKVCLKKKRNKNIEVFTIIFPPLTTCIGGSTCTWR